MQKLVECVPNFSEGRRISVIKKIANSAKKISGVRVLDVEWDKSHNRSLVTIVGAPEPVLKAAYEMIKTATEFIDMRQHKGEHPRIGATDVVPFVPVSGVTLDECVLLSNKLAQKVAKELKIPVYLYEAAAKRSDRVNLADVRRGEYEGLSKEIGTNPDRKPDYGPSKMHPTAGAMVVGARKYLIAYNVNLDTKDVGIAKKIASKIREKSGGLSGVKALGFEVGGFAQVSMNLVDFEKTNFDQAYRTIEKEAKKLKVGIKSSEIYGMIPLEAIVRAIKTTFMAEKFNPDQLLEKRLYE
ncbi:glutamate formimidoyltransferase [Candidatus Woesebacteria bacterium RBG_19FT_COMBO_42_9]|uniref:glutamate formimidoyltransferase n=1 Tax=Candidatus Woesebacteria bacterium RBG_16_42_24 TaxID=1802485 RepID=A0A1F7XJV3_9BACT|nr:MAG: glutamate formimidoyltransferase [Candidatus Woesebacteria bacterium RBG_16_42_24]OGM17546.1 MAG: glutamate formimidoyltransferase [Candidatus Woesebacteria bacterium RBG_19FT_COMBO_42_9]OGM67621.1 MAG: glutamate formimidoyltransferase [Candidatus Woesebacteria bacterium RIFCSPLOWO2_01_FULL_43_11]